jgi:hypothetical protein
VPILRRDGELDLTDADAALLLQVSAATINRRLAGERAKMMPQGRSHTKPGSLLKSQIPIRLRRCGVVDSNMVLEDDSRRKSFLLGGGPAHATQTPAAFRPL